MLKVTIFNENSDYQKVCYPNGIHAVLKEKLKDEFTVNVALQEQEQHGLTEEILNNTDVLIWWSHCFHDQVSDEIVERVCQRVLNGMGIIFLHSAHNSKPFKKLMGTTCSLKWRIDDKGETLWNIAPYHPIMNGIGESVILPQEEVYGEFFDIPKPDELIMIGSFEGGEVFRSACVFYRGNGKIFYFQPGHDTYPIYYQEEIIKIIKNGVNYTYNKNHKIELVCKNV